MKIMKFISLIVFIFIVPELSAQSQPAEDLYSKANALYNEKKYEESVETYNELLRCGYTSDEVYYNLGNACFRNNDASGAIWCYEKCLLLNAGHDDANANLEYVNRITLGNQENVPENFFRYAWHSLYAIMSWRSWTYTFIVVIILLLTTFILFLLSASNRNRRFFFFTSAVLLMAALLSLAQSLSGNYNIKHSKNAIVVHEALQMRSSPDAGGTGISMIQPGIKVRILEYKTPWLKVITPDGTQGWVAEDGVVQLNALSPIPVE